ncbi:MAG: hypothetical protein GC160_18040 [Acidobacteria bacterium]|nr:hypothetical protein [Acidobacteriota bacterium]
MSDDLLEILCCPETKVPVEMLAADRVEKLNRQIAAGKVTAVGGETVQKPVQEALITTDGKTIYRIDDNIPVMLVDQGVATRQLEDW